MTVITNDRFIVQLTILDVERTDLDNPPDPETVLSTSLDVSESRGTLDSILIGVKIGQAIEDYLEDLGRQDGI